MAKIRWVISEISEFVGDITNSLGAFIFSCIPMACFIIAGFLLLPDPDWVFDEKPYRKADTLYELTAKTAEYTGDIRILLILGVLVLVWAIVNQKSKHVDPPTPS